MDGAPGLLGRSMGGMTRNCRSWGLRGRIFGNDFGADGVRLN
jgi:hypothetical protein